MKTRGSKEADVIRSTLLRNWSPEAEVIRGSEDDQELKIIRSWKTRSFRIVSKVVLITPIIA